MIAAKLHCAPDVHAIKAALALALPSVQGQMESLAVDMGYSAGVLAIFYKVAIGSGIAPLVIFMGVGAMTDFGPLLANPRTLLLGAAAQFGIFATVLGAMTLNYFGIISFTLPQAAAIGIIGGADGPTAIYLSGKLAPELLGAIAVAAYSYMALVPLIQPPIMKALTTDKERKIRMVQLRTVSKREKILFPAVLLLLVALLLPDAAPLLGMFCFGNLMRESGVVERLSDTVQNALINIVTIFLGLSVGAKLVADKFLQPQTLGILVLGVIAFCVGTAAGVLMAKLMNVFSRHKINPLIGSAGVSAVPMAARVSNKVGLEADGQNFLLMHAYSYMALVPLIQPPIMKALTTDKERKIRMVQLRTVSKREKILFPAVLLLLVALLLPDAAPLLGMFCFGNLMRESGVVERLSDTVQNALINIVTIFLGLSVGAKLVADKFLQPQTLGILVLGVIAFCVGTAAGVLMAKLMNVFSRHKINPLIGSAGVSAVPMAARVSNKVGLEADGQNFLLMHAMGPNVAGVIGSAIAAGGMLKYVLAM
ncbi:oxaloacetate decarboxylase subunit beta [Klebsiella pneumoniae]|nr:oxaloacetate decarboxylase subunit beta [Klebsiella pneumoniae]